MSDFYKEALHALHQMDLSADQLLQERARVEAEVGQEVAVINAAGGMVATPALEAAWIRFANVKGLQTKHTEWGRKIHGVLMGYARELSTAHKNILKGRIVGFSEADVTVGTAEPYAKAVQHKHTVSPENSAVNEMIAKAANQLTGESGEAPLATQRKVIDVMINDPENWWPFDLKDFNNLSPEANLNDGVIPLDTLKQRGAAQILTQLTKYKKGSSGLNQTTAQSLLNHNASAQHPFPTLLPDLNKPRSSVLYTQTGARAEVLTIKMTYGQPRVFWTGPGNTTTVSKVVFIAYLEHGKLRVEYSQHF